MKTKTTIGLLIIAAAIISLPGCAVKKAGWGSLENGMIMKYAYAEGQEMQYKNTFTFEQKMDVMDQEFLITAEGDQLLHMKAVPSDGPDQDFTVTVKEMRSDINSPQGKMTADISEVIDKPFQITVSALGKELDFAEAEALSIAYKTGETRSIASDIQAFFPDLPDHPVKVGDVWESSETVTEKSRSGEMVLDINNLNTFEKLEEYNGYDCMKISVVFSGTMNGNGEEQGMTLKTTGKLDGSATWYYAYKEGLFVGQTLNGMGKTTTEITGPREMTLPATRTYIMISELLPE